MGVFASRGYAEASMDEICRAAGCSKGGLYHHFPTKAAVLGAVVGRLHALGALVPPLDGAAAAAAGVDEHSLGRLLIDLWAEAARSPALQASMNGNGVPVGEHAATLASVLQIGALIQRTTRLPDVGPEQAAARIGIQRAA